MDRLLLALAGIYGFLGVGLGAFGAHGLRGFLAPLEDGIQRADWWETGARYQLVHALAIGLAAWVSSQVGTPGRVSGLCFAVGIALFSGSLYTMTLTGIRWLGAVTPIGGVLLMAGWGALIWAAARA